MNYLFCKIAIVCILICFVQRCIENPLIFKYSVGILFGTIIPLIFGLAIGVTLSFYFSTIFTNIGWYPKD